MIITSSEELEIGKIYNENTNPDWHFSYLDKTIKHFAFKVIEKVSRKEFDNYLLENFSEQRRFIMVLKNFYRIQTD